MSAVAITCTCASIDYARLGWYYRHHHGRFTRFVESRKLTCQDCGGRGGYTDIIVDGLGPWEPCGWCEGTGYVSPWLRGQWLKWKREGAK